MNKKSVFLVTILTLSCLIPLISLSLLDIRSGTGYQWTFYYAIGDEQEYNTDFTYGNDIDIYWGGKLTLSNLTFTLSASLRITIYEGGSLIFENVTIASQINGSSSYKICIRVYYGGSLLINNSHLNHIGYVYNNYEYGDGSTIWTQSPHVQILNSIFTDSQYESIVVTGNQNGSLILENNQFILPDYSFSPGIYFTNAQNNNTGTSPSIQNNRFSGGYGLQFSYSNNFTIYNNTFDTPTNIFWSNKIGIRLYSSNYITIRNCSIVDLPIGLQIYDCNQIQIEGNDFRDNREQIYTDFVNGTNFEYNRFRRTGQINSYENSDFEFRCNNSVLKGNRWNYTIKISQPVIPIAFRSYDEGSYVTTFENNELNDQPMLFWKGIVNETIDLNNILVGHLVFINCMDVNITNANISNAGGIAIENYVQNIKIQNISIGNTFTIGVSIGTWSTYSQNIQITDCLIEGAAKYGIKCMYVNDLAIKNSNLSNNFIGIFVEYSFNVNILNNIIRNNGDLSQPTGLELHQFGGGSILLGVNYYLVEFNEFRANWYYALMIGSQTINSDHGVVSNNDFIQFIAPLFHQYSKLIYANSTNVTFAYNTYSDHYNASEAYAIEVSPLNQDTTPRYIDSDNDGVSDITEKAWKSNNNIPDSDGDMLSDYDEIIVRKTDPTKVDTDNDALTDYYEILNGTNPFLPDSDFDGYPDGLEVLYLSDPTDPDSFPGSRVEIEPVNVEEESTPPLIINSISGFPIWGILIFLFAGLFLKINRKTQGGRFE
jgi:parallel beta-helix repeat protein